MVALALDDLRRPIDAKAAVVALLVSVLWGANPVAIKIGLDDVPPLRMAWMRFAVGSAVVLGWAWATGRLRGLRVERAELRPLLVLGLVFTAQIATMNVGTALTSAAHAAILLNLYAVHTVVLAHLLIPGDRLTPARAFFVTLSALFGTQPTRWTAALAGALLFQSVVIAGFNFIVNLWLLRHYRPGALAAFFLTQPIFGVLLAHALTGDPLTVELFAASVAVAVGIGLTTR